MLEKKVVERKKGVVKNPCLGLMKRFMTINLSG
jgi:hypothetical protein